MCLCSSLYPGSLLIKTSKTLVSAGTERMLVDFGKVDGLKKQGNNLIRLKWC